ncbi:MAG TPA: PRC-barrel domain-containing protein [Frankiaceae bacterium]|jgi:sporulation protein YlmC with PRC-barrel domain|nr:PRC-barrel domain-containing protein [Frankiaceae bacterium]
MHPTDPASIRDRVLIGADGSKLGKVENVFLDNETDKPERVAVSTGLFGRHVSLVPLAAATESGDDLQVPFDKETVKGAPHHDPDQSLTEAQEIELFE